MDIIAKALEFIQNLQPIMGAASQVVAALIALALLIPGEQPEKALKGLADLLAKISKK